MPQVNKIIYLENERLLVGAAARVALLCRRQIGRRRSCRGRRCRRRVLERVVQTRRLRRSGRADSGRRRHVGVALTLCVCTRCRRSWFVERLLLLFALFDALLEGDTGGSSSGRCRRGRGGGEAGEAGVEQGARLGELVGLLEVDDGREQLVDVLLLAFSLLLARLDLTQLVEQVELLVELLFAPVEEALELAATLLLVLHVEHVELRLVATGTHLLHHSSHLYRYNKVQILNYFTLDLFFSFHFC